MSIIDNLEKMLTEGRDSAMLRYGLGQAYLNDGQADKAVEHLRAALDLDGRYSAAWKLYGKALAEAGETPGAIKAYAEGIRVAEEKGDIQAAKEMRVFKKRLEKAGGT